MTVSIAPFKIAVSDAEMAELHARIDATRWPGALDGVGWGYGIEDGYLRSLMASWRQFDWRTREAELNALPHFRATIDGVGIHFIHIKGKGPRPLPLMLSHGWPSSVIEWLDLAEPLSDPAAHGGDAADAFELVIPSLPGFGFSDFPAKPGMTPRVMAGLFVKLMQALGYGRFAAHGCDWGSYVTSLMALDHPDRVIGAHMGMVSLSAHPAARAPKTAERAGYSAARKAWAARELGYVAIQSTKPQTLAYGLTDSPAGLAAWIAEKWRAWSDHDGAPEQAIARDALLTNLSIYWFTRTINSASRLYYESRANPVHLAEGERVLPPAGFFLERPGRVRTTKGDDATPRSGGPPRSQAEMVFNVARWTEAPRGGHFPGLETPDLLAADLRDFFRPLRG